MDVQFNGCNTTVFDEAAVVKVADLVAKTSHQIVIQMMLVYIKGRSESLSSIRIAENRISMGMPASESKESLEDIQMIFNKLFEVTMVQKNVSPPLVKMFEEIDSQNTEDKISTKYITSFVVPETHVLMQKLRADHPGAIECKSIWQVSDR